MTPIAIYKYSFLILFTFCNLTIYSVNKDTTIVSRWRDGSKKAVSIYKLYRTTNKAGNRTIVLKKLKDVKYYKPDCESYYDDDWNEFDKCEVSKKDFEFSYSIYNKMDSLQEAMRKRPKRNKKNIMTLYLGDRNSRLNFPMNINIGDTNLYAYKKRDTLILGKTYSYQVFMKDSLSSSPDFKFNTALRTDTFIIYCFDTNTQSEILKADIEAMTKEMGEKIVNTIGGFMQATFKSTNDLIKSTKSGATKGLRFILVNLILMQK